MEKLLRSYTELATGTAPDALKMFLVRWLKPPDWRLLRGLADSTDPSARQVAALLVPSAWLVRAAAAEARLRRLARDESPAVRDWVALAIAELVTSYSDGSDVVKRWASHSSVEARRAAAVGTGWAAASADTATARRLLDALTPLMADGTEEVRYVLAPITIGDGMLRYHPDLTLAWLGTLARGTQPQARWAVARALGCRAAKAHQEAAWRVLAPLVDDREQEVRQAARLAAASLSPSLF
ncbi:MAG: hypothetical protein GEV07_01245 [Streptosporangiales bacterium]|nr:hypothetical protein [Streptosporangiales bacterium]